MRLEFLSQWERIQKQLLQSSFFMYKMWYNIFMENLDTHITNQKMQELDASVNYTNPEIEKKVLDLENSIDTVFDIHTKKEERKNIIMAQTEARKAEKYILQKFGPESLQYKQAQLETARREEALAMNQVEIDHNEIALEEAKDKKPYFSKESVEGLFSIQDLAGSSSEELELLKQDMLHDASLEDIEIIDELIVKSLQMDLLQHEARIAFREMIAEKDAVKRKSVGGPWETWKKKRAAVVEFEKTGMFPKPEVDIQHDPIDPSAQIAA